jgi:hypothetical protein
MVLNVNAEFPQSQTFVLKLRRESAPAEGRICGRLEHVTTGQQCDFRSLEELLTCLICQGAAARQYGEEHGS